MKKLIGELQEQLKTEYKKDAEDCLLVCDALKDTLSGNVKNESWDKFITTISKKSSTNDKRYKPTIMGYTVLDVITYGRKWTKKV